MVVLRVLAADGAAGVDDIVGVVSNDVVAAFKGDAGLVVATASDHGCRDDDCARAFSVEHGGIDVVWGTLSSSEALITLELHLFEVKRDASVVRARLEAPERGILEGQINDAAIRMVGGEPTVTLSPVVVAGGLIGGLSAIAAVAGGASAAWCFVAEHDAASSTSTKQTAHDLWVPSLVTLGVGAVGTVVGVAMVGAATDD